MWGEGILCAERRPARTWRASLRRIRSLSWSSAMGWRDSGKLAGEVLELAVLSRGLPELRGDAAASG